MSSADTLKINEERLWQSHMDLGQIGATPKGGVCRLALTDLDRQGRDLFVQWVKEAGCEIRVDAIGNIFARRPGQDNSLDPVMTGSHIDTQPTGGKFDGNYGVLAGLEVIRTLNDHGVQTRAPLEVVVWTNEEGSRFVPVMMGSGVYVGAHDLEETLRQTDLEGISVGQALKDIGYDGPEPAQHKGARAYFEAHIEQGPVLENNNKVVGVVTGALGQRWYDVTITGQESHAGTTPMDLRKDALMAASHMVLQVNQIAQSIGPDGRGTVGYFDVFPNSRNVIPGRVSFSVDLRAATDADLDTIAQRFGALCEQVGKDFKVVVDARQVVSFPPQPFADEQVQAVRRHAQALGYEHMDVVSGAGHDAVYMARVTPSAMIFVPCKDGISHNELESAEPGHLAAGCNVLLHAMLEAAN